MLKIALLGFIATTAALSASAPSKAQQSREWVLCANREGTFSSDIAIAGCTAVINSRTQPWSNVAIAYDNRGLAYQAKREYDRAVADHTKAIELNPKYATAYNNRGIATGDYDRAIADYNRAIELDPNFADAYLRRGLAYEGKGDSERSIADYTKAIVL